MLHSIDSSILFLKEEEVIKAGALDMKMTLAVTEEVYKIFGEKKILNPPKLHMPMPTGSDADWKSYSNAMPCYIGGDFNICGVKWASESKKNSVTPGIPYGIDITILSDPDTVLPFCILDGTLITAMRTSAVAGLFAKYTAPKNTENVTLVGAGVIGRTMVMAICEALPGIKKIYIADLDLKKAENLVAEYKDVYHVEFLSTSDTKTAAADSQLIVTETTSSRPFMDESWLRPGITVINMASNEIVPETILKSDIIAVDYWDQIITNDKKGVAVLHKAGKLEKDQIIELSEMVLGKHPGRENEQQIINCSSMGLGALDIMIGYKLFLKAQEMGLGTMVKLWDKPLWE